SPTRRSPVYCPGCPRHAIPSSRPTRRSSDLPIDTAALSRDLSIGEAYNADPLIWHGPFKRRLLAALDQCLKTINDGGDLGALPTDRKSTRLNSSHVSISYAGFCLKNIKSIHS